MISEKDTKQISKFLSYVLRHDPDAIGVILDGNGWTDVEILLRKINDNGHKIDIDLLTYIVDSNNKKRFAFNDTKDRIRASQGHSIVIDLGYTPLPPPEILYHGTAARNVDSILKEGIQKGSRHHVHLSADKATATSVGGRHGKPVILEVMALDMHKNGHEFFCSANEVWLTEEVPAGFIKSHI